MHFTVAPLSQGTGSLHDHIYAITDSSREMKRKLMYLQNKVKGKKKKCKAKQHHVKRLKKKVEEIYSLVASLRERYLLSQCCATLLATILPGIPKDVIDNMLRSKANTRGRKYFDKLKEFAGALQFYSTEAYRYVRNTFSLCLPYIRTSRSWYSKPDGEPGFNQSALLALKNHMESNTHDN